jgi:hypothetical protein
MKNEEKNIIALLGKIGDRKNGGSDNKGKKKGQIKAKNQQRPNIFEVWR